MSKGRLLATTSLSHLSKSRTPTHRMASTAMYSSTSLKAANAQPYNTMKGELDPMLLLALQDMNFQYMTPVQSKVLGGLPSFQSDCLVQAKTGTGKTTAFLLPAIQNTITEPPPKGQVSVLIMCVIVFCSMSFPCISAAGLCFFPPVLLS